MKIKQIEKLTWPSPDFHVLPTACANDALQVKKLKLPCILRSYTY